MCSENNAEENRIYCLFLFPIIAEEGRKSRPEVEELIMLLAYALRAFSMDSYSDPMHGYTRSEIMTRFYRKYTHLLPSKTVYNLHALWHTESWMHLGAAHQWSAFKYEKSYAKYKKVFRYGQDVNLNAIYLYK